MVRKSIFTLVASSLLLSLLLECSLEASQEFYVSPTGDDGNTGTKESPVRTLQRAKELIIDFRSDETRESIDCIVWVFGGRYFLEETFTISGEDPFHGPGKTLIQAVPGERVVLTSGEEIGVEMKKGNRDLLAKLPVESRNKVKVYSLNGPLPYPHLNHRSLHQPMVPAPFDLYSAGRPLTLARWPNQGWARVPTLDENNRWKLTDLKLEPNSEVWGHGFWDHNQEDSFHSMSVQVGEDENEALLGVDQHKDIVEGARYRLENLLSQLDEPGEWYLDKESSKLVVWPLDENEPILMPRVETLISVYEGINITFRGLELEGAQCMGMEIAGGKNVHIEDCKIRCCGDIGIHLYFGADHVVKHCEISHTGANAVRIEAGDRTANLEATHLIQNNDIHDCCHLYLSGRAAIAAYGVGIEVNENHIHDLPSEAISLAGDELVAFGNDIHDVCSTSDHCGAIYVGHNPTYRGIRIEQNHITRLGYGAKHQDVVGIFLDDFASGCLVRENVVSNSPRGIVVGGGNDNQLIGNQVFECKAGIQIDDRSSGYGYESEEHIAIREAMTKEISTAMLARYPELAGLIENSKDLGTGNRVVGNRIDCEIGIDLQDGLSTEVVFLQSNKKYRPEFALERRKTTREGVDVASR